MARRRAAGVVEAAASTGSRDHLAELATDLFARFGYAGTSMREIAAAAGCTIGNLYHHHRGKEALLLAILDRSVATLPGELRAAAGDGAPPRRFERLVRAHLAAAERYRRETRIFSVDDEERLPAVARARSRVLQNDVLAIYVAAISALARKGSAEQDPADREDVRITAFSVLGVINWRLRWSRTRRGTAARVAEEEAIARFILLGVGEGHGE